MKRYLAAAFLTSVILFPLFWYVYQKGAEDGVVRYKRSKQFEMTLQSMYRFGLADCGEDKHVVH